MTVRALAALALVAAAALSGCVDAPSGIPPVNKPPHVTITSGPRADSTSFYAVPIQWDAWDDDGRIAYSLYCVDNVDSAWIKTTEFNTTLVVSATDSVRTSADGYHTFYVKCVDNEGMESPVAQVSFNARTIAPQTRILFPIAIAQGQGYNAPLVGGPSMLLRWTGIDIDGVQHRAPTAYLFKRLVIPANYLGDVGRTAELLARDTDPWERIEATSDTLQRQFNDLVGTDGVRFWVFALKAIDEAGATERGYLPAHNLFFFAAYTARQGPALNVFSLNLGTFDWQGAGRDSAQYGFDAALNIVWLADPGISGATINGYRWGVDVVDPQDDRDPGWAIGWNRSVTSITGLVFRDRQSPLHDIYIQARDSDGAITTGVIRLSLVQFTGERDVLWVDDAYDISATGVLASEKEHHDAAVRILSGALAQLNRPAVVDTSQCFPVYIDPLFRTPPRLGDLMKYKIVVWSVSFPPGVALWDVTSTRSGRTRIRPNQIASYLDAGGVLVLTGTTAVRATIDPVPTFSPISTPLRTGRGNFAADYWHVADQVSFARDTPKRHGLLAMRPTPWAETHGIPGGGGFPKLEFDAARWYRIAETGRVGAEFMTGTFRPNAGDDVQQLYLSTMAGGSSGPFASDLNNKCNAFLYRAAPRDPAREDWAYQVAYFSVPLVDMKPDQMTGAFANLFYEILQDKKYARLGD